MENKNNNRDYMLNFFSRLAEAYLWIGSIAESAGIENTVENYNLDRAADPFAPNPLLMLGSSETSMLGLAGIAASLFEKHDLPPTLVEYVGTPDGKTIIDNRTPKFKV